MTPVQFSAFMARFFPSFLLGLFSAVLGIAFLVVIWDERYWHDPAYGPHYLIALVSGLILPLCLGHFLMIRGYTWAIWLIRGVLGISLLMSLSLLTRESSVLLGIVLLAQSLSLLVLNSLRHREMRARLVELRRERRGS